MNGKEANLGNSIEEGSGCNADLDEREDEALHATLPCTEQVGVVEDNERRLERLNELPDEEEQRFNANHHKAIPHVGEGEGEGPQCARLESHLPVRG